MRHGSARLHSAKGQWVQIVSRSEPVRSGPVAGLQRAQGRARVRLRSTEDGTTRLVELFQEGCLKLRLPQCEIDGEIDIALINTSGGLTGGDALSVDVVLDEGARATVTTPACERIYRPIGGEASVRQRLQVGRGARLDWIPQETILFDRARFWRRFDVRLETGAEITLSEAILFGRTAMGETVKSGGMLDFWTIRQDDRLLFADAMRISEPFDQTVACPTTLDGNFAFASLVHVGQGLDAKRDLLRAGFSTTNKAIAAASVVGGVLVARIVAPSGTALRSVLSRRSAACASGAPCQEIGSVEEGSCSLPLAKRTSC